MKEWFQDFVIVFQYTFDLWRYVLAAQAAAQAAAAAAAAGAPPQVQMMHALMMTINHDPMVGLGRRE